MAGSTGCTGSDWEVLVPVSPVGFHFTDGTISLKPLLVKVSIFGPGSASNGMRAVTQTACRAPPTMDDIYREVLVVFYCVRTPREFELKL